MMKIIIDEKIFRKVSPLQIGVLVLENIDNTKNIDTWVISEWQKIAREVRIKFENVELGTYPTIKKWREIYKSFGEKQARSSIESLIKRVRNGKDIYNINPLVDIYNLASLKFELPCGGEDLSQIKADLELTEATGNEEFVSLGETEIEKTNAGEIVYKFAKTLIIAKVR